jgi:hypothetical protein
MNLPFHINGKGKLVNKEDFSSFISKYIGSSASRQSLAQAMIQPIRRQLDYQGIARRVFTVEPMPEGGAAYYFNHATEELPKFKHDLFVITPRGKLRTREDYRLWGNSQRVTVPTFEIVQNPTIRISDVKRRRFI